MFLRRRMLMAMGMEDDEVKVKKYTYIPQAADVKILEIPLDFEPGAVILYDNYPNDYYMENGSVSFENNGGLPLLINDGKYNFSLIPFSDSKANLSYNGSNFSVSYDSGILNIDIRNTYKKFYTGHTYTIVVIEKMESEQLE